MQGYPDDFGRCSCGRRYVGQACQYRKTELADFLLDMGAGVIDRVHEKLASEDITDVTTLSGADIATLKLMGLSYGDAIRIRQALSASHIPS